MRHQIYRILLLVLVSGLICACAATREKQLKTEGFTLSYKNKSTVKKTQTSHPLKVSEAEVRYYLKSLIFKKLTLFGKAKPVFFPDDIDRIARLITKAMAHVPNHKIVHYALQTTQGNIEGDIFANKKHIHWRFDSINGRRFSGSSSTSLGGSSWKMVPQPGQKYQATHNLLGTLAQKNWVIIKRQPNIKTTTPAKKPANSKPSPATAPLDPALEKKLELLKDLREKELIDEKEYDQKKKELLDNYL